MPRAQGEKEGPWDLSLAGGASVILRTKSGTLCETQRVTFKMRWWHQIRPAFDGPPQSVTACGFVFLSPRALTYPIVEHV